MFDKKLSSHKLGADGVRTVYTIRVVGGTQLKNPASRWDLDRRHVRFTKNLEKSPKTIGAENDQGSMLYNLDP